MPKQSFVNLSTKVILNQIVLGPCVIAVVFAWNNLWLGKLSELPSKYQNDALPTLLYGLCMYEPRSPCYLPPIQNLCPGFIGYIHPTEKNVKEIVLTGMEGFFLLNSSGGSA
ncbi:uncharacterized protein LOC120666605 isoform X1 [Panicum virgatum]|uniref:uncharacterized protein LOC120666605 isoform X1 n=1 Tax=Panicum virgatum TaxID=38727 RepID=UPI0019D67F73|nr:uncharacterized protein LOC120666605 isoform X1 [Panicum virgatum]